jgi:hypothetical protein
VNVAVAAAAATVTEPGTVTRPLLLLSDTDCPPVPAAFDSVTVQVELAPELKLVGLQESWLTTIGADRAIEADCEVPFTDAVTEAVWSAEMLPAVALNVALKSPAATITFAGTVSRPLLLLSDTCAPPVAGAFVSVTVHVELAPEPSVAGLHESELTPGATSEKVAVCEPPFRVAVTIAV